MNNLRSKSLLLNKWQQALKIKAQEVVKVIKQKNRKVLRVAFNKVTDLFNYIHTLIQIINISSQSL